MDVPFEVNETVFELGEEWATLSAENLRRKRLERDPRDAEPAVSLADKIEDHLVGNTSAPIEITIDEGLPMSENLDAILIGAVKTRDETAEKQIRALCGALDARLKRHLEERHGSRGPGR